MLSASLRIKRTKKFVWELTDLKECDRLKKHFDSVNCTTRGCTGFDGLTEDGEAVRGRTPR